MHVPSDVLVIEDDMATVEMLMDVLQHEGYASRSAYDCTSALSAVATRLPDLILLDATMTDDETSLLRKLCSQTQGRCVIAAMSATPELEGSMLDDGAVAFLAKPFSLDELFVAVASYASRPWRLAPLAPDVMTRAGTACLPCLPRPQQAHGDA